MGLLLVENEFFFPPFVVQHDQSLGRVPRCIQQRGQQPVLVARARQARIVQRVLDDPHQQTVLVAVAVSRVDAAAARAALVRKSRRVCMAVIVSGR